MVGETPSRSIPGATLVPELLAQCFIRPPRPVELHVEPSVAETLRERALLAGRAAWTERVAAATASPPEQHADAITDAVLAVVTAGVDGLVEVLRAHLLFWHQPSGQAACMTCEHRATGVSHLSALADAQAEHLAATVAAHLGAAT